MNGSTYGKPRRLLAGVFAFAASLLVLSATLTWLSGGNVGVTSANGQTLQEKPAAAVDLSKGFRDVAQLIRPSVVSIDSIKHFQTTGSDSNTMRHFQQGEIPEELRQFFGNDDAFGRFFDFQMPQQPREQRGLGSGVIVREDGYILTNNHVVGDSDEVDVRLSNGKKYQAKIIGTDKATDLAVLKIDANGLSAAKLGSSGDVQVGDWVLAIGSPFGLNQTVTAGIISAKSRSDMGITDYEDFLQTDAAINPGNSGGPLVTLKGEVIGINTAIASRSGGYMGVGFAIPSDMAKNVMDSIIKNGHVTRGFMGAMIQDLNGDLAKSFNYDSTDGVLIGDVVKGGPSDKAGLQSGDIVTKFDGQAVKSANELRNAVARTDPGKSATLDVVRDGKKLTLDISVGKLSQKEMAAVPGATEGESQATHHLGLTLETLTPDRAQELGIEDAEHGVLVTRVDPGSEAYDLGLRAGDVIVSANGKTLSDADAFEKAVTEKTLKSGVRLQILRDGARRFAFLRSE